MQVRVFTLSFNSALNGFDDDEVREFVKDKEVLSVRDHFFAKDESRHLAVVLAAMSDFTGIRKGSQEFGGIVTL